jgi:hypothetical protein
MQKHNKTYNNKTIPSDNNNKKSEIEIHSFPCSLPHYTALKLYFLFFRKQQKSKQKEGGIGMKLLSNYFYYFMLLLYNVVLCAE